MFIYKITNALSGLCYIGLDTHAEYKQKRWKEHRRDCHKKDSKFYKALRDNIDSFVYEIIYRTDNLSELLLKEIEFIELYNSYKNGYNSSPGGDAFGHRGLKTVDKAVYDKIIQVKRDWVTELNKKKWQDTTPEERKYLCRHLHTPEIYEKKSKSLAQYWATADDAKKGMQLQGLKTRWQNMTDDERLCSAEINRANGSIGAKKVSKKVKVQSEDGSIRVYESKSEFNRTHGEIINAILRKTKENKTHRGFMGWEI